MGCSFHLRVIHYFLNVYIFIIVLKISYNASLADSISRRDFLVGGLNFTSMYCSNEALKFVNYPFMVLAKSAKIMPGKFIY